MAKPINLGTAGRFAVLAGTVTTDFAGNIVGPKQPVTNNGFTTLSGDLGVSPGLGQGPNIDIVGFPPGIILGTIHDNDSVATTAHDDLVTAYDQAITAKPTQNLSGNPANIANDEGGSTGLNLGGMILPPGVYKYNHSALLSGTLTLDGQNNPNAVWIFQIGTPAFSQISADGTFTTKSRTPVSISTVQLINGAVGKNVFWAVGNIANIGPNSHLVGTVMAVNSIFASTLAEVQGGLLSISGTVSLDNNIVQSHLNNNAKSSAPSMLQGKSMSK